MTDTQEPRAPGAGSAARDHAPGGRGSDLPDPQSIVTPDAFSVAPELVGTPLAAPWRRLAAIVLDLVLIGFLKLLGWRFVLGGAALMLFLVLVRPSGISGASVRPTPLRRVATGCAGAVVLVVTVLATVIPSYVRHRIAERAEDGTEIATQVEDGTGVATQVEDGTADADEAGPEQIIPGVLSVLDDMGMVHVESETGGAAQVEDTARRDRAETLAEMEEEMSVGLDSMLTVIAAAADAAAADTARESNDDDRRLSGTAFEWIRDAASEAGLVFGWGTVYITLFLTLWGGRTPGKRALDLRVVRVTGKPLGLLMSFERAGGYAAGFATGLLGFARVWWDPNRQGIHDKIAETVVIRESLPKVPGLWESAARRKIPVAPATHGASPSSQPTEDAVR